MPCRRINLYLVSRQLLESGLQKVWCPDIPTQLRHLPPNGLQISLIERDLREVLRATRTIKNTFIPINKLPPEILSNVLEHRTGDRELVVATHVCQRWRSTLISSPSLWACFRFTTSHDINRTSTYLERSKSAPIDIGVSLDLPGGPEVFKYLAPHIARTRHLTIQGHHTKVHTACLLLRTPSPTLRHLLLRANGGIVRLPDDFLGRQAPSLRSIILNGIFQPFESHFPLPSLIEFNLSLWNGMGPLHVGALFQFLSGCPWLRKIFINAEEMPQTITLDRITSLESLVELDYLCTPVGRILPYLRLPRLERLQVSSSFGPGQNLADLLPHGGHTLLAGATEIKYHSHEFTQEIKFSGKGTDISFTILRPTTAHTPVDWFPDDTSIPFGQIEDLTVEVSVIMDLPFNVVSFENLRVLRIIPRNMPFVERFLGSLYPYPGAGVPCRSLQEIEYPLWGCLRPLINLTRERNRAGHQLELVCLLIHAWFETGQNFAEELKEYVGEVQTK